MRDADYKPPIWFQGGRDAAELVRLYTAGDEKVGGEIIGRCQPTLVADQLARYVAAILTTPELRQRIEADPALALADWRASFGDEPLHEEPVYPPAPEPESQERRNRAELLRDAAAILEGIDDYETWVSIMMLADSTSLVLLLARECIRLADGHPAATIARFRRGADAIENGD